MTSPVSSYDEWSELKEVIVGRVDQSCIPPNANYVHNVVPKEFSQNVSANAGQLYPSELITAASNELTMFIEILQSENIVVKQPKPFTHSSINKTPHWQSQGFSLACPRDGFFVYGDEILVTPMSWRCRYFEYEAYYDLFIDYFEQGATFNFAPRPLLRDQLYEDEKFSVNESEIVFDAADFIRLGDTILVTRSHTTNQNGIKWMKNHFKDRCHIHEIHSKAKKPMHIDSSIMPLAHDRILYNPEYVDVEELRSILDKKYKLLACPKPNAPSANVGLIDNASMTSGWISMNVLAIGSDKVIVEYSQQDLIVSLRDWGFKPIPCPFIHYMSFGGQFHCATLDIKRKS